jgi:DNA polymerase III subunit gamma/tau
MSHTTFYRKYRSQTFDDLVGQKHIIQTLKNAIKNDRLSHAYIYSGPRGTGKTSTARILAKALNCREGKSTTPCLKCDLCEKITMGSAVDVIEIDAASNTGVDNIRVLNEQIGFKPVECLYKMYIIDEAHMLSTGAFNALLKTLEEPPENTVFILATTEPHKIPITIHSRCQHLSFGKLASLEIMEQIKKIAVAEKLNISEKSMTTIAKNSSGCMRDAVSLLDQIYSFEGNNITQEGILFVLGTANFDCTIDLFKAFFGNDKKQTLEKLNQLFLSGINIMQFAADVTDVLKQILLYKMGLKEHLDLDDSRELQIAELAKLNSQDRIQDLLENFSKTELELRSFPNPELLLQIRFLSLMKRESAIEQTSVATQTIVQPPTPIPTPVLEKPATLKRPEPAPTPQPIKTTPKTPPIPTTPASDSGDKSIKVSWREFLHKLKEKNGGLHLILKLATLLSVTNSSATISLQGNFKFHHEKLAEPTTKELINNLLTEVFGRKMIIIVNDTTSARDNDDSDTDTDNYERQDDVGSLANNKQKINQIIDIFEGKLV